MTPSPQLRALGPEIRLLAEFLDAIAAYGRYCLEVQARVDTAALAYSDKAEGWNHDAAVRQLKEWGAKDQYGIYAAAGLSERQAEVAFMFYDRCLEPSEIGKYLGCDAVTVRVHLHKANERLRRLGA